MPSPFFVQVTAYPVTCLGRLEVVLDQRLD